MLTDHPHDCLVPGGQAQPVRMRAPVGWATMNGSAIERTFPFQRIKQVDLASASKQAGRQAASQATWGAQNARAWSWSSTSVSIPSRGTNRRALRCGLRVQWA
jgi:hypothetical protein